ncbi:penicillin-binding protein 2 [Streptacidiphilus fuscans]|uniref:Penicillin-binding protein 2 n=1 Tax=Streptacidiphilus fuscans TaxID=2789292 RepID=A0A931B3C9_9ACTN|nr:penicillin-binding protein 2 [Streptacidiphilus fuscans]MBF9070364.1 penicillin-binding protein 2 [Streptacidiphilus fuscans]
MGNIPETGRTRRVTGRLLVLQVLVLSMLGTLGGRLWFLQIRDGASYVAQASSNHIRTVVDPAVRGEILDDMGVPLADNTTKLVVTVSRTVLMQQKDGGVAVLTRLGQVLGMTYQQMHDRVRLCDAKTPAPCWNGSPYQPIPVTETATTQQAMQIMERQEDFPGVTASPTAVRYYPGPDGANAAQILGYLSPVTQDEINAATGPDGKSTLAPSDTAGRAGLEYQYDKALRGTDGATNLEVDNLGRVQGTAGGTPAVPGDDVVTSIDARIQGIAEQQLNQALLTLRKTWDPVTNEYFKADSGAVVVMNVHTGQIVAMASAPTYNPNIWTGGISAADYAALNSTGSDFPLLNRAIQGQSAPGSTFKVISTTAALNAGYGYDSTFPCTSSMTIGGRVFKNFEGENYGMINLSKALEVSCDTVFYNIAYQQWLKDGGTKPTNPKDWLYKTAHQFGLGANTGIDLPGEVSGRVPDRAWHQQYYDEMKDIWCQQAKTETDPYLKAVATEDCVDFATLRAGDEVNYAIGQGDTLVTPIQMARIYSALANGGTIYQPQIAKAIVAPGGKVVQDLKPVVQGHLPDTPQMISYIDQATANVVTSGTAAWKFQGWPQDKIQLHAKTGTAEVVGKQTTSWFDTYTKDYAIVMTISQGGTGSGGSGPAVRNIYNALYGIQADGSIDPSKAIAPASESQLPNFHPDGTVTSPVSYTLPNGTTLHGTVPGQPGYVNSAVPAILPATGSKTPVLPALDVAALAPERRADGWAA